MHPAEEKMDQSQMYAKIAEKTDDEAFRAQFDRSNPNYHGGDTTVIKTVRHHAKTLTPGEIVCHVYCTRVVVDETLFIFSPHPPYQTLPATCALRCWHCTFVR